jgi:hypothetical protein
MLYLWQASQNKIGYDYLNVSFPNYKIAGDREPTKPKLKLTEASST